MAIKINNNTVINDNRGIVDINNQVGVAGSVLVSTGTAIKWENPSNIGDSSTKGEIFFISARR